MTRLIVAEGLSKKYRATAALTDINLSIDTPVCIGLVGKNGAGKTTLLSILSGSIRQSAGTVKVLGHAPQDSAIKGKVSILLQDAHFKKGLPVIFQLEHFAQLQGFTKQAARDEIAGLLRQLNNADYAGKNPEQLSWGQRKRLGIVQAFIGQPELILLDEPTAGLDPLAAHDVRKFIQTYTDKSSFIISSHNLYEIEDICSDVVILDKGKLIAYTKITELAGKDNSLTISLDRAPSEELLNALSQLPEITDLKTDSANQEKITLYFSSKQVDKFQLQVQTLIIGQGFSLVQLHRGKALVDGVLDLVDAEN